MSQVNSKLERQDSLPIDNIHSNEIMLFCAVYNEAHRLPYFLDYYRNLGVDRFFVVDNASDDGSREFLLAQKDVHYFYTEQSYAEAVFSLTWMNELLHKYGTGHWCITADADELFVFPLCEYVSLKEYVDYLDRNDAEAVLTLMIDMYGERMEDSSYQPGRPFSESCPHFDTGPYWASVSQTFPYLSFYGGVRHRYFFADKYAGSGPVYRYGAPVLRKVPLVKWSKDKAYLRSMHCITKCQLADTTGALLHYKMVGDFKEFVTKEVDRQERPTGEYEAYLSNFKDAEQTLISENTAVYESSSQLLDLSCMVTTKKYLNSMRSHMEDTLGLEQTNAILKERVDRLTDTQAQTQPQIGQSLSLLNAVRFSTLDPSSDTSGIEKFNSFQPLRNQLDEMNKNLTKMKIWNKRLKVRSVVAETKLKTRNRELVKIRKKLKIRNSKIESLQGRVTSRGLRVLKSAIKSVLKSIPGINNYFK